MMDKASNAAQSAKESMQEVVICSLIYIAKIRGLNLKMFLYLLFYYV